MVDVLINFNPSSNLEVPELHAAGRSQVLNGLISPKLPPKKLFKVALQHCCFLVFIIVNEGSSVLPFRLDPDTKHCFL